MGETETPDAPTEEETEEEDGGPVPTDPDEEMGDEPKEGEAAAVEPTLSLEEFGLLEGLAPPLLAALSRWVRTSGRPRHGTASAWQQAMRDMQSYVPH